MNTGEGTNNLMGGLRIILMGECHPGGHDSDWVVDAFIVHAVGFIVVPILGLVEEPISL